LSWTQLAPGTALTVRALRQAFDGNRAEQLGYFGKRYLWVDVADDRAHSENRRCNDRERRTGKSQSGNPPANDILHS
jgi:hypothetical protein